MAFVTLLGSCSSPTASSSRRSSRPAMQPHAGPSDDARFAPHWARAPLQYVARRLPPGAPPLSIDGDLEKPAWTEVEWSEPFGDIRGPADAPADAQPTRAQRTRMKMRWDDEYLYVAAQLESDFAVLATFTERNSAIFTEDSDFEVFVDPAAATHAYKELEINARNTVWNLMLDRPYGDAGSEHSARVAAPGEPKHYEVERLRSATRVTAGALGGPGGATWTVELAMAHNDTLAWQHEGAERPAAGRKWRINFSRVERKGEINWVWSPQIVWDAEARRYAGKVAMHLPDAWGWVQFAPPEGATPTRDATWPARLAAANVYYAQQQRRKEHGAYAGTAAELAPYLDVDVAAPFELGLVATADQFNATIAHGEGPDQLRVRVRQDRLMKVMCESEW